MRGIFLAVLLALAQAPASAQTLGADVPASGGSVLQPDLLDAAEAELDSLIHDGKYDAAEALAVAILTTRQSLVGPASPDLLTALFARGDVADHQDRLADMLEFARQAHGIAEAALPVSDLRKHIAAMRYALALSRNGRAHEALPLAVTATQFAVLLLGPATPVTLTWKFNVAGIYVDLGQYDRALPVFDEVLAAYAADPSPERRSNEAVMTRQRARLLGKLWRDAEAADGFAQAVALYSVEFGPDHPETARTGMEYAQALLTAQRYEVLAEILPGATRRITASFGPESYQAATMIYLQAFVATGEMGSGRVDDPVMLINQAVTQAEAVVGTASKRMTQMYLDQAGILEQAGDYQGALTATRKARDLHAVNREAYLWALFQAREAGVITPDAAAGEALEVAQLMSKTTASAAIQDLNKRLVAEEGAYGDDWRRLTDLIRREDGLQVEMAEVNDQPLGQRNLQAEARVRNQLTEVSSEIVALRSALGQKDPAKAGLVGEPYMPVAEIQAALGPDDALVVIDASEKNNNNFVFVVTTDRVDWAYTPATTAEMATDVAAIRDGIALRLGTRSAEALDAGGEAPRDFDFAAANRLYDQTFGLVDGWLHGKTHIYVVPNGPISALPPGLLLQDPNPDGDLGSANWLIRDYALTVLPSVASLRTATLARQTGRADLAFLGFGDPAFDAAVADVQLAAALTPRTTALRGALIALPETAQEVRQVAKALGAGAEAVHLGPDASESALKGAGLSDYRVIYFATHGLVAGDIIGADALDQPALALTAGTGEDGFLTETEVAGLKLNADWVVLSACNTAVGGKPGAEALSGLAQAFFYAGARALLVSHWPVESRSAVALMTRLFDLRGADPQLRAAEAQRRAILAMLDAPTEPRWRHPAFWAPFILVGSPD